MRFDISCLRLRRRRRRPARSPAVAARCRGAVRRRRRPPARRSRVSAFTSGTPFGKRICSCSGESGRRSAEELLELGELGRLQPARTSRERVGSPGRPGDRAGRARSAGSACSSAGSSGPEQAGRVEARARVAGLVDRRVEVADVGVEPAPVADDVAEDPDERGQQTHPVLEVRRVLLAAWRARRRAARGSAAASPRCRPPGRAAAAESAIVPFRRLSIAALRARSSPSSRLPSLIRRSTSASRSASTWVVVRVLASSRASSWSREEIVRESRLRPSSAPRTGPAAPSSVSDRTPRLCASWSVSRSSTVVESCENAWMTSNGARVRSRGIDASGSSGASPGGLEVDVLLPEHRLDLDRRRGAVADPGVRRLERDDDVLAVQLEVGDRPDPDARDADVVVGLHAGRLAEARRVRRALPDEGQVPDVQRRRGEQQQDREAGRADRQGVPLAERLHPLHRYAVSGSAG